MTCFAQTIVQETESVIFIWGFVIALKDSWKKTVLLTEAKLSCALMIATALEIATMKMEFANALTGLLEMLVKFRSKFVPIIVHPPKVYVMKIMDVFALFHLMEQIALKMLVILQN